MNDISGGETEGKKKTQLNGYNLPKVQESLAKLEAH